MDTDIMPDGIFTEEDLIRYAEVLLWGLENASRRTFKKGDVILIRYDHTARYLMENVYALLIDKHFRPVIEPLPTPFMERELYQNGSFGQLIFQQAGKAELYQSLSGIITLMAPERLDHLAGVDPQTMAEAMEASAPVRRVLDKKLRAGKLGWTMGLYPTQALADVSNMSLKDYAQELKRCCFLMDPDPVKKWRRTQKEIREIASWLDSFGSAKVHVESDLTDLTLEIGENRRWWGCSGENLPCCEIFTSPDYRTVTGKYFSNQPTIRHGKGVVGVELGL